MLNIYTIETTLSNGSKIYAIALAKNGQQIIIECVTEDAALKLRDTLADDRDYYDIAVHYAYIERTA